MRIASWRESGETIVLHQRLFRYSCTSAILSLLEECRSFGSKLVLGLNFGASISRLKGPTRPIVGQDERARVMAALAAVDAVVLFEEDTPLELVRDDQAGCAGEGGRLLGGDSGGARGYGRRGGRVEIIPIVEGCLDHYIVNRLAPAGPILG